MLFVYQCSKFMLIYNQVSLEEEKLSLLNIHLNLNFGPLDFLCRTVMVMLASLPLEHSKMIVMSNNNRLPLVVLVLTIKMELWNGRLLSDRHGHCFFMLKLIGLQLLISNYGHLPYNMLFIFGIFVQINRLSYHIWSWCLHHAFWLTHLQCLHGWGCPNFVLDPKLQDGKKLPKWSPRSCLGCFVGYSGSYLSTKSSILNLYTGFVSPQYHLVHDDWFINGSKSLSSSPSSMWYHLISIGY